jgi:hypothetical protein
MKTVTAGLLIKANKPEPIKTKRITRTPKNIFLGITMDDDFMIN